MEELRKVNKWSGEHKGVAYEINNFDGYEAGKQSWTYYLHISPDRIPDKELAEQLWLPPILDEKERVHYDYYKCWIADLDWHCGITFYDKVSGFEGGTRWIKAGCDFQHYWDEGKDFDLALVRYEAIQCVESFLERVPDYKLRCGTVGGFWSKEEGIFTEGKFISYKGVEWWLKQNEKDPNPYLKNHWWYETYQKQPQQKAERAKVVADNNLKEKDDE